MTEAMGFCVEVVAISFQPVTIVHITSTHNTPYKEREGKRVTETCAQ